MNPLIPQLRLLIGIWSLRLSAGLNNTFIIRGGGLLVERVQVVYEFGLSTWEMNMERNQLYEIKISLSSPGFSCSEIHLIWLGDISSSQRILQIIVSKLVCSHDPEIFGELI